MCVCHLFISLRLLTCYYYLSLKLMSAVGMKDFSMQDVMAPTSKRFRRALSAIINFAKFREEQLVGYTALTEQTVLTPQHTHSLSR